MSMPGPHMAQSADDPTPTPPGGAVTSAMIDTAEADAIADLAEGEQFMTGYSHTHVPADTY